MCRNGSGWTDIHADDLNARFKEIIGDEYTVKDLRTWHGTVLAAAAFADADPPGQQEGGQACGGRGDEGGRRRAGQHTAVARSAYVDPRVMEGYQEGLTIAAGARPRTKADERQSVLEKSTRRMIRTVAKS